MGILVPQIPQMDGSWNSCIQIPRFCLSISSFNKLSDLSSFLSLPFLSFNVHIFPPTSSSLSFKLRLCKAPSYTFFLNCMNPADLSETVLSKLYYRNGSVNCGLLRSPSFSILLELQNFNSSHFVNSIRHIMVTTVMENTWWNFGVEVVKIFGTGFLNKSAEMSLEKTRDSLEEEGDTTAVKFKKWFRLPMLYRSLALYSSSVCCKRKLHQ